MKWVEVVVDGLVERRGARSADLESISLVSIQCAQSTQPVVMALRRAALRIRQVIRFSDSVLLQATSCTIVLPGTTLMGARAVEKRVMSMVVEVKCTLCSLSGIAAQTLLQQIQEDSLIVVLEEGVPLEELECQPMPVVPAKDTLPYLAFLEQYPSHRLLHCIPYELAQRYHCIPVGVERGMLTLATCQKLDQEIVEHLCQMTQRNIFQVRCEPYLIDDVLHYWQRLLPQEAYPGQPVSCSTT